MAQNTTTDTSGMVGCGRRLLGWAGMVPDGLLTVMARLSIAGIFWRSGQTKLEGWSISEMAVELFRDEYKVPLLPPETAALLATVAEHVFPILLVIGLATRLSALGLLGMTLVIQVFVYPDAWPIHGVWAVALLFIISRGAGMFSLDHLIARRTLG